MSNLVSKLWQINNHVTLTVSSFLVLLMMFWVNFGTIFCMRPCHLSELCSFLSLFSFPFQLEHPLQKLPWMKLKPCDLCEKSCLLPPTATHTSPTPYIAPYVRFPRRRPCRRPSNEVLVSGKVTRSRSKNGFHRNKPDGISRRNAQLYFFRSVYFGILVCLLCHQFVRILLCQKQFSPQQNKWKKLKYHPFINFLKLFGTALWNDPQCSKDAKLSKIIKQHKNCHKSFFFFSNHKQSIPRKPLANNPKVGQQINQYCFDPFSFFHDLWRAISWRGLDSSGKGIELAPSGFSRSCCRSWGQNTRKELLIQDVLFVVFCSWLIFHLIMSCESIQIEVTQTCSWALEVHFCLSFWVLCKKEFVFSTLIFNHVLFFVLEKQTNCLQTNTNKNTQFFFAFVCGFGICFWFCRFYSAATLEHSGAQTVGLVRIDCVSKLFSLTDSMEQDWTTGNEYSCVFFCDDKLLLFVTTNSFSCLCVCFVFVLCRVVIPPPPTFLFLHWQRERGPVKFAKNQNKKKRCLLMVVNVFVFQKGWSPSFCFWILFPANCEGYFCSKHSFSPNQQKERNSNTPKITKEKIKECNLWEYFCTKKALHATKQNWKKLNVIQWSKKKDRVHFSCICFWVAKQLLLFWQKFPHILLMFEFFAILLAGWKAFLEIWLCFFCSFETWTFFVVLIVKVWLLESSSITSGRVPLLDTKPTPCNLTALIPKLLLLKIDYQQQIDQQQTQKLSLLVSLSFFPLLLYFFHLCDKIKNITTKERSTKKLCFYSFVFALMALRSISFGVTTSRERKRRNKIVWEMICVVIEPTSSFTLKFVVFRDVCW